MRNISIKPRSPKACLRDNVHTPTDGLITGGCVGLGRGVQIAGYIKDDLWTQPLKYYYGEIGA